MQKIKVLHITSRLDKGRPAENSLMVGTLGRLVSIKGLKFLVKRLSILFFKYPDTFFIFIGDGYLTPDLEKKTLDFSLKENIIFLGW